MYAAILRCQCCIYSDNKGADGIKNGEGKTLINRRDEKRTYRDKRKVLFGDSWGIRTPVAAVRGRSLNHLTKEPYHGSGNWIWTSDTAGMNRML